MTLTSAYPAIEEDKQNLLTEPQGAPGQAQFRSRDPCGGAGGHHPLPGSLQSVRGTPGRRWRGLECLLCVQK